MLGFFLLMSKKIWKYRELKTRKILNKMSQIYFTLMIIDSFLRSVDFLDLGVLNLLIT